MHEEAGTMRPQSLLSYLMREMLAVSNCGSWFDGATRVPLCPQDGFDGKDLDPFLMMSALMRQKQVEQKKDADTQTLLINLTVLAAAFIGLAGQYFFK